MSDTGIEFRKSTTDGLWHWCHNCIDWPVEGYAAETTLQKPKDACPRCQEFTEKGLCKG
jgi:hypothetical protein